MEKKVKYIRNITDIDDKIIEASKNKKIGYFRFNKICNRKIYKRL